MAAPAAREDWADILAGVLRGEEEAAASLYRELCRVVRPYLNTKLGDQAEDAMHSAYLRVWSAARRGAIRHPEALGIYSMLAARCEVTDILRRRQAHPEGWNPDGGGQLVKPGDDAERTHIINPGNLEYTKLGVELLDPERLAISRELAHRVLRALTPTELTLCSAEPAERHKVRQELGLSKLSAWRMRTRARTKARRAACLPVAA